MRDSDVLSLQAWRDSWHAMGADAVDEDVHVSCSLDIPSHSYQTGHFFEAYEEAARANLTRSLGALTA